MNYRRWPINKRWWVKEGGLLLIFLLALTTQLKGVYTERAVHNLTAVQVNRSLAHPYLPAEKRLQALASVFQKTKPEDNHLVAVAALEYAHLQAAIAFLQQLNDYNVFEPGMQLLHNPDFTNSLAGWVEYNSRWQIFSPNLPTDDLTMVTYSRAGEGHASLSQTLQLESGACYLFSLTGSVERRDNTPTYWFYLETYDDAGKPTGQSLERKTGSQDWAQLFAPFCLPGAPGTTTKITVAPVNLYGDATVHLGSARLYQLLPAGKG